jgi:hypothetical protein
MEKDKKQKKKDEPLKLDMPFEEALKKALNTPLLKKQEKRKKRNKMERIATIIDFNFAPKILVISTLDIIFELEHGPTFTLSDHGTIKHLSIKYGFTVNETREPLEGDFTGFIGRKCIVWLDPNSPGDSRFLRFVD